MQSSEFEYKKYLQLIIRSKKSFLVLALLIMAGSIVLSYLLPRKYVATSTVFIEKNVISELVKGITVTPSMEDTIKVLTYAITSRTLLTKVVDGLDMNVSRKQSADLDELIRKLQRDTIVKVKDRNLFTISFTDSNPKVARDFVNTLVRFYIEENTSSKRGESYDATKFLSEQIDSFKVKLEKAEADLNNYKRDKGGVIAIDEGKLFQEINNSQQKLYDLELRRRHLEGMRTVTRKAGDPLQSKKLALQKRLEELRVEYTDSYPEIIKVKGDIETVSEQMKSRGGSEAQPLDPQELARIESEITAIKAGEESLRRYLSTNQALLKSLPSAKAGLEKLELAKNSQKNIYDQLFARHGQSEVSKQMEVQDKATTFRIVDPAVIPTKPASPNRLKIMLLGILAGIAGSTGIILLLDQMDQSVKSSETLKSFGVPLLAVIPHIENPADIELQLRQDRRLYAMAGLCFAVLLFFPVMEVSGLGYVDRVLDLISPVEIARSVK